MFSRVGHTGIQPTSSQGHTHWSTQLSDTQPHTRRPRGHSSFLQTSSIGITTTCSDNLLAHTQHNSPGLATHTWEFSCHLHKATKTATVFSAHTPSSVIKLTSATISGSLVHRTCPLLGHVASQRDCPCPQPSNDHTLARHMTITIHTPPTTKPLSQPTSEVLAPHYLPTETPHSH